MIRPSEPENADWTLILVIFYYIYVSARRIFAPIGVTGVFFLDCNMCTKFVEFAPGVLKLMVAINRYKCTTRRYY